MTPRTLFELPIAQAMSASMGPEAFFATREAQWGDPFPVSLPGSGTIHLTADPGGAKEIFTARPEAFEPMLPNPVEPLLGPGSLILLSGERHKRERKLLAPPFHGRRMKAYAEPMRLIAEQAVRDLSLGVRFDARTLAQSTTLSVIIQAIFGVTEPQRVDAMRGAIETTTASYSALLALIPGSRISMMGWSPWDRFRAAVAQLDKLLKEAIDRKRQGALGEDILSLLLSLRYEDGAAMSDDHLLDELRTMLVAGHETAATTLAWCLGYVHQHPEVLARAVVDGVPDDAYLVAIIKEAQRRHPAVPIVLRRLRESLSFRGRDFAAGDTIGVALTQLHRRPDVWERPDDFYPEHFVDKKYTPFQYAPYGGGARRCAGAAFADFELRVLLATLLRSGRFESRGPLPKAVTHSITMSPGGPIWMGLVSKHV